jgi:hypothetical protein
MPPADSSAKRILQHCDKRSRTSNSTSSLFDLSLSAHDHCSKSKRIDARATSIAAVSQAGVLK